MSPIPFRLNEFRAKVQFVTSAEMPSLIRKACVNTGVVSNTVYIQHAIAEALARDLSMDYDRLVEALPPPRGRALVPFGQDSITIEEVR